MSVMRLFFFGVLVAAVSTGAWADVNVMRVDVSKPVAKVPDTMYGLFFEDINYAADGGLYAELVKNRSFEFPQTLMGWETFGRVDLRDDGPFERKPHYVRLSAPYHRAKTTGLTNEGYFGMGFEKDSTYRFNVWARTEAAGDTARLRIELIDQSGQGESQVLARSVVAGKLVKLAANTILENGNKIAATCPYAVTWFERHPEYPLVCSGPSTCRIYRKR